MNVRKSKENFSISDKLLLYDLTKYIIKVENKTSIDAEKVAIERINKSNLTFENRKK